MRQAALIVRRIAEALAYAHGKGVVHCDIKPANIFMVGRTSPKVLDFGIARVAQRPDLDTRSLAAGSPYYMAPEQVRGDAVDRRCDVYSLGVVLYELLTGRRAHSGATLDEITDAVMYRVAAPANAIDPRVPPALAAIAARAMAKDVEERHRSARQLARELRVWLGEEIPRRRRRKALMSWRRRRAGAGRRRRRGSGAAGLAGERTGQRAGGRGRRRSSRAVEGGCRAARRRRRTPVALPIAAAAIALALPVDGAVAVACRGSRCPRAQRRAARGHRGGRGPDRPAIETLEGAQGRAAGTAPPQRRRRLRPRAASSSSP